MTDPRPLLISVPHHQARDLERLAAAQTDTDARGLIRRAVAQLVTIARDQERERLVGKLRG